MATNLATERTLTVEQWVALPEDEPGELVDGRLVEEEVPDFVHEVVVAWLIGVLHSWASERGGLVGASGSKLALGPRHGRRPDVVLYVPPQRMPPRRGPIRVPPYLAVEVLSLRARDVRRDRVEKPEEYARFAITHYWLVDPEARVLECFTLDERSRYVRVLAAGDGHVRVPGFEDLVLDLDGLWLETARLDATDP